MPDPGRQLRPARLFLALWPEPGVRRRLAMETRRLHDLLGGRPSRPETLHLTLAFIGNLDRQCLPGLLEGLAGVQAPAIHMILDRADCWRHNRVAYLAPRQVPETLASLVRQIEEVLADQSVEWDRRAFRPHVTLLRKAEYPRSGEDRTAMPPVLGDVEPIQWTAGDFVLVESVPTPAGVRYELLGRFPLL